MMLSRKRILEALPRACEELRRRETVVCAYLFGSCVEEGRDRVRDVDVAVLALRPLSFGEIGGLCLDLGRILETDSIDIVDLSTARSGLRFEILAKGKLLVDNDPERSAFLRERALSEHLARRHTTLLYYQLLGEEFQRSFGRAR